MLSNTSAEHHQQSAFNADTSSAVSGQPDSQQHIKSEDHFESPDLRFPTNRTREAARSFMQQWPSASAVHQSGQTEPGLGPNLRAVDRSPPADRARNDTSGRLRADQAYNTAPPQQPIPRSSPRAAVASTSFASQATAQPFDELHTILLEGHPPFMTNQASNYHRTTLSRYLAGQHPLPLPRDLSRSIPSTLPPVVRISMAEHILRSSPGAAPQLYQWIESRLRPVCPAGSGDLTYWIYSEPDPAQQWRVYWAIYDAFGAGVAHGRQQHLDESNARRAQQYVSPMGPLNIDLNDPTLWALPGE